MTILEKLDQEIKESLKARNQVRLDSVRLIKTAVKNKEIEFIRPLTQPEFFSVLSTMAKQRHESIDQFKKGGRTDLVEKEEKELAIISSFLPQALSDAEIDRLIAEAISQTEAKSPKDMGLVMKALKEPTAGRADGKVLSEKVKSKLGSIL